MKTVKEILTENRDSVISSIKWTFKVWKHEDLKVKMFEFLDFCEKNIKNPEDFSKSKRIKTDLKNLVNRMFLEQKKAENLRIFGKENPKLEDIIAYSTEYHEQKNEKWDPIRKNWVKC